MVVAAVVLLMMAPPAAAGVRWKEVPVTATNRAQQLAHNSPLIVADPGDPDFLAMASRIDSPDFGCELHVSEDGGEGWLPVRAVTALPPGAEKCYAPELAFDREGRLYFLFIGLRGEGNSPVGAYLVSSNDRGRTFSSPVEVLGPERYMVRLAIDQTMGERGRLHLVWLQAGADPPLGGLPDAPNPIMASYSDDGGETFSRPVRVSDASRRRAVAPAVAVGRDHALHVLYYDLEEDVRDYQGLEGPAWDGTWSLVLASSSDGGRRFGRGVTVDDDVRPAERVMLIFTMPPPALVADDEGRLYASWPDARNGDSDVLLSRSSDRGKAWEQPRRLNDDRQGNGRHQYLPRLAVSEEGRLDAIFYDRRADRENLRNDVFYTFSRDAGSTFSANAKITGEPSDSRVGQRYDVPSARDLVEFGSRLGLVATPSAPVAAWTDTRNAATSSYVQDIFATRVELEESGGGIGATWPLAAVASIVGVLVFRLHRKRARPAAGESARTHLS